MSDKPTTAAEVLPPKTSKKDKTDLELYLAALETAESHKAGVLGDFQRRLTALATDKKLLEEKGLVIDWSSPDFTTPLKELGLFGVSNIQESSTNKSKKTNGAEKDWSETKAGKGIMDKYNKGVEFSVSEAAKKLGIAETTARIYLSKGSSAGYLESMGNEKYKRVK